MGSVVGSGHETDFVGTAGIRVEEIRTLVRVPAFLVGDERDCFGSILDSEKRDFGNMEAVLGVIPIVAAAGFPKLFAISRAVENFFVFHIGKENGFEDRLFRASAFAAESEFREALVVILKVKLETYSNGAKISRDRQLPGLFRPWKC